MRSCQRRRDTGPKFKRMNSFEQMSGFGGNLGENGNGNLDKDKDDMVQMRFVINEISFGIFVNIFRIFPFSYSDLST